MESDDSAGGDGSTASPPRTRTVSGDVPKGPTIGDNPVDNSEGAGENALPIGTDGEELRGPDLARAALEAAKELPKTSR